MSPAVLRGRAAWTLVQLDHDQRPRYPVKMQVVAFSSPAEPEWRWRIIDYSGVMVEESRDRFATISAAVAAGTEQLVRMSNTDRGSFSSAPSRPRWAR